ncbi:unnamed protein product [Rhizophagus irregularis]|nr:unnamed protein product [Rhizophagus irregularis]
MELIPYTQIEDFEEIARGGFDFGRTLQSGSYQHWQIGDLGLTRHANDILSNNEINEDIEQFNEAEKRRLELLELKKLGPEFTENSNSGLIYTNFSINLLQSNIKPNSLTKRSNIKGYFTRELDFDIDDIQRYLN